MKPNRQRWMFYISLMLAGFAVAVILYLLTTNMGSATSLLKGLFGALQPVLVGIIMTYLLYPLANATERFFRRKRASKRVARAISVACAATFLVLLFFFVGNLIIPELAVTISTIAGNFQSMANDFSEQASSFLQRFGVPAELIKEFMDGFADTFYDWLRNDLTSAVNTIASMASGLFGVAKIALNLLIGFIVMIYMLFSRDQFTGQSKKILYALCGNRHIASKILQHLRRINAIFGGFLTGKVIDSLIIGCICFFGVSILQIPYGLLISVVVCVTNIIPVFGPFIGGIPCAFLLLLTDPAKCLIFVIFIIILQQIDGNIIGPMILGDSTGLPAFWVLVSLLLFQYLFGFWGMIIGVPLFASFYYLARELVNYLLAKRDLPTATAKYVKIENINQEGEIFYLKKKGRGSFRDQNRTEESSVKTLLRKLFIPGPKIKEDDDDDWDDWDEET